MPVATTISFQGMEPSPALRGDIEHHAEKLAHFAPRLLACDVTVKHCEKRHHQGNRYLVRIRAQMPGAEFEAGRTPAHDHSHEDVYVATRDAFDALRRQLEDHLRTQRDRTKEVPTEQYD